MIASTESRSSSTGSQLRLKRAELSKSGSRKVIELAFEEGHGFEIGNKAKASSSNLRGLWLTGKL